MKLEIRYERDRIVDVFVFLSERNLLTLLDKLYWDKSARTIATGIVPTGMRSLVVTAEKDQKHYQQTLEEVDIDGGEVVGRTPGEVHPRTEAVLEEIKAIYGKK